MPQRWACAVRGMVVGDEVSMGIVWAWRYVHFIMQLLDLGGQQEARVGEGTRIEFTRFFQSGGDP